MSDSSRASGAGIGFLPLLGLAFIVLKLTGHIDWSWWVVTLPLWGGAALALCLLLLFGGGVLFKVFVLDARRTRRSRIDVNVQGRRFRA